MTDPKQMTILVVDDNPEFLSLATELVQDLGGRRWSVISCMSGGEALAHLQRAPVDLIALDVNMPVLDGVQLLGLLQRRFPSVLKVVLTGEASPEQRAACLTAGAELVLDKPVDAGGWGNVTAAIDLLLQAPKEEGFRGVLRRVSLPDVIQMECLAANSSVLEITGAGMRGRLYIQAGQIVHGEIGAHTGVDALNNILCLPGGSFHLLPFQDPDRQTIFGPWEFLLMEAARLKDEGGSPMGSTPETPPASPALEDLATEPDALNVEPDSAVQPPAAHQGGHGDGGDSMPAETTTGMRPVVKETLICSLQGDVLYDWNSPDAADRVALLEFVTRRAGAMAAQLPLGRFERFECVDKGVRCVAKLEGDQALFVRVQSVLGGGPYSPARP